MWSWFKNLFSGSISGLIDSVSSVVDELHLSGEEKMEAKLKLQAMLLKHEANLEETARAELVAKERILVAELSQGDNYTKRARPTVVYFGLLVILLNYVVVPFVFAISGRPIPSFELPTEFWLGWSGIVATWSVGRTLEKRGVQNKAVQMITGGTPTLPAEG